MAVSLWNSLVGDLASSILHAVSGDRYYVYLFGPFDPEDLGSSSLHGVYGDPYFVYLFGPFDSPTTKNGS